MKKIIFIFISFLIAGNLFAQWNTDRLMTIGRNAMFFEDYVVAIQYFNQVITVKPHLPEPFMFRGMAKAQLGDFIGADRDLTEALNRNPFVPQAFYARGFARHRLGFFQEAADDFSRALDFSPNSSFILLNRMAALANLGNYEKALTDLERFMRMNPRMTEILHDKGRLLMAMNDTVGAIQVFDQFIEAEPYNSMAWSARALLFLQDDDLENALIHYNRAIELGSRFAGDFINRGIIHVRQYNFMQALSDYDAAIRIDGTNLLAFYNRALLRANLGDTNNALEDLNTVLRLDDTQMEARLRKAMLEFELGNFQEAINDYRIIIDRHPNFIPAYIGIAHSFRSMGNITESQRYAVMAMDIEEKLAQARANATDDDYEEQDIVAENLISQQGRQSNPSRRAEVFNRFVTQDMERAERESRFASHTRGTIQYQYTDLVTERNFVLTFYARADVFRRTNLFHPLIEMQNRERNLSSTLRITNNEIPLTEEATRLHFSTIEQLSRQIQNEPNNAVLLFSRAMEYATVHDFAASITDLDRTISLQPDFALAYFMRANIRYRQAEFENLTTETPSFELGSLLSLDRHSNFVIELVLSDYNRVIALAPDFSFAYFNKANVLAGMHNFSEAIRYYTRAIEIDPNFAEAYFNRGLLRLFIGEDNDGMSDLSIAGELGMYTVYNLIQRFSR